MDYRIEARVAGRVQRVGFRFFTVQLATELGLTGWVANRHDGTVQVIAEGSQSALESLLARLWEGPASGLVLDVSADWQPATGEYERFGVKSTR